MSKNIIQKDVTHGDLLPTREIIQGKVTKQRGIMNINGERFDYFMERIVGSEAQIEIYTFDGDLVEVKGALFEVYLHSKDGTWQLIDQGMLPVDIDLYGVDGPQFMI